MSLGTTVTAAGAVIGDEECRSEDINNSLFQLCRSDGECLLDPTFTVTPPPVTPSPQPPSQLLSPLLLNTANAAQCRRKPVGGGNNSHRNRPQRAASDLVLKVAVMEEVHGVDVSWLHKPSKGHIHHRHTQSTPDGRKDAKAPTSSASPVPQRKPLPASQTPELHRLPSPANVTPPTPVQPTRDITNAYPSTPTSPPTSNPQPKRPSMFNRPSTERVSQDGRSGSKRASWMNSISSKFSSQSTPERPGPTPTQLSKQQQSGNMTPSSAVGTPGSVGSEAVEEAEPYVPSRPKESSSSFFSSLTRRLSSQSQTGNIPKVQGTGGVCPRQVLNVDPNRERCLVPEMDPSRLRRVSFCVDVEIAGGQRYREEDDEDDETRKRRKKDFKMRERGEAEALKHPEALKEETDADDAKPESKGKPIPGTETTDMAKDAVGSPPVGSTEEERDAAARKREKKQRSEAERKERKEKRRRRAEENGQIPVEVPLDDGGEAAFSGPKSFGSSHMTLNKSETLDRTGTSPNATTETPQQPQPNAGKQDHPTTDPARIYRRCCQLRESPILKRITEQLSNPKCILPNEHGIVNCLDLTGSRLQLADVVSLGDWLAVVPVKNLKLEDADLSDEGVRCILAGLLAAKRPESTKRKSTTPRHRESIPSTPYQERAGVVEKLTLKNNPRLSRSGWKHISLFIYMCRSLKGIDLSMNQFPQTLPPSAHITPIKSPQNAPHGQGEEIDAAEALYKCLSERVGGSKLEELIMSECSLTSPQVRKVVDGAIMCGVSRLGLAGNHLDDQALEYVIHYLKSGICLALDLGGNDLRGRTGMLADALNDRSNLPCWGLSLAGCNLDSASLKPLLAAVQKLPNFRFIDLSHNRDLCGDNSLISLLRRYISQMKDLKRIHLADVGMSPKQAIALADALPEGPRLAHVNLLQNPQLTALAHAKTEADQEEATALYASLMAAVRVSNTLICIDIDVPSAENSEVVKALAKQVVAYSLRNMETFAIAEATGDLLPSENAASKLTGPYGGEQGVKEVTVPDVLMHLVGHAEDSSVNDDSEAPAPDEDYIVGGTGIVKALQYVLGEKANDKRKSLPPTPTIGTPASNSPGNLTPSGARTPSQRPSSSTGLDQVKAKKMSKNLLGSARKIRSGLQPALAKSATGSDELSYRRLLFLDQTLQSMIERFEEEYPETRLAPPSPKQAPSETSSLTDRSNVAGTSINTQDTELTQNATDEEDDEAEIKPKLSRQNSDVNQTARALGIEEGHIHRIGQQLRREVIDSPRSAEGGADWAPWKQQETHDREKERLEDISDRLESYSGDELRRVIQKEGWDTVLHRVGASYDDLRMLQEQDKEGWELFKDAQLRARQNLDLQGSELGDANASSHV